MRRVFVKQLNFNRYSKRDLLWLLRRLSIRCCYDIEVAMADLEYEKEKRRIAEAEAAGKMADKKRREYIALMFKYDGGRLADMTLADLKKAQQLLHEAEAADRKFAKLLGLDVKCAIVDELHTIPKGGGR